MPTPPIIISTTPLAKSPQTSRSEVLHLKFTKPASQKNGFKSQIYKTRIAILPLEIYKAVIVQSLKFTQKVTVNHMLPFPSALYTFVTHNKQTNKHYVNSADHCILPFM